MNVYIGCKIVKAEPMIHNDFLMQIRGENVAEEDVSFSPGYHILYPDNYHSWCPKAVFEAAYRRVSNEEAWMVVKPTSTTETDAPITLLGVDKGEGA